MFLKPPSRLGPLESRGWIETLQRVAEATHPVARMANAFLIPGSAPNVGLSQEDFAVLDDSVQEAPIMDGGFFSGLAGLEAATGLPLSVSNKNMARIGLAGDYMESLPLLAPAGMALSAFAMNRLKNAKYADTTGDALALLGGARGASQAPGGGLLSALPMDEASRMARAREMGFDVDDVWYHGSTHDVGEGFQNPSHTGTRYEQESYAGPALYLSDSIDDVNANYAGTGPDLTNRIDREYERLESGIEYEDALRGEFWDRLVDKGAVKKRRVVSATDQIDDINKASDSVKKATLKEWANERMAGGTQGVVYDVLARQDGVVREDEPFFTIEAGKSWDEYLEDARNDPSLGKNPTDDDIEELAYELQDAGREEAIQELWNGPLLEIRNVYNGENAAAAIVDRAIEYGELSINDIKYILDDMEVIGEMDDGTLMTNAHLAFNVAKNLGVKGFVMNAFDAFPGMQGTSGARHLILSDPSMARSTRAAFDPAKKESSNLLASLAPLAVPGLLSAALYTPESTNR